MKRVGSAVWLFSFAIAVATHGAAVLAFAALLHDPMGMAQSHTQLTSLTVLSTTIVSETSSENKVAKNSEPADVALKPVSSTDTILSETAAGSLASTVSGSPEISEQPDAKTTDPVVVDVVNKGVGPDTILSEAATIAANETSSGSSKEVHERAESSAVAEAMAPTVAEATGPSIVENTEQSNEISAVEPELVPSDNATAAANQVATEVEALTEQAAQTETSVVETESSAGLGETLDEGAENTAPAVQMALVVPRTPPIAPQPPPDPPKPADVLSLVEQFEGGSCFFAVPEQDQVRNWLVRSYGAAPAPFDLLETTLQKNGAKDVSHEKRTIQTLQCGAIDFAKSFATKTNDRFKIKLQGNLVQDGGELNFLVSGFEQKWLYVTMVDDDGIATDISPFAKVVGADVRLTMPVHIKNAGKFRNQLLLAISSDQPLTLLDMPEPRPFVDVLPLIKGNIIAAKANVVIAIADFSVE